MTQRIDADVLVPGCGEPIADATVLLDGSTITYAGPRAGAPESPHATSYSVPAVMPGMWDCHTHLMGMLDLNFDHYPATPIVVYAARSAMDAGKALNAGVTSVREVGGLGVQLARAVDEGSVPGPHIYAAGAILSATGGHGDIHCYPVEWMNDLARRDPSFRLCDGVPECLLAVREQLRANARLIKICASGGVLSEVDHPVHQQFSDEELRAIVEEAARAERVVAAHCHGKPGIVAALRAGAHTIEHGSCLDEECAVMMRDQGAVLVPTRTIVEDMLALGEKGTVPAYAMAKLRALADQHFEAIQIAIASGVTIAMGTDIGTSSAALPAHWGEHGVELTHLVKAGMSPLQAIEAATATAPSTLGPQAPKSGLLSDAYDADVIAVTTDPTRDVSVLADPVNVTHVWKSGVLMKEPLTST
ncbi:MAG: amidohydrolase family protein [Actinomycetes bacterium]